MLLELLNSPQKPIKMLPVGMTILLVQVAVPEKSPLLHPLICERNIAPLVVVVGQTMGPLESDWPGLRLKEERPELMTETTEREPVEEGLVEIEPVEEKVWEIEPVAEGLLEKEPVEERLPEREPVDEEI